MATVRPFFLASTNVIHYVPDTCLIDVTNAMRLHHIENRAFSERLLRSAMSSFLDLVDNNIAASRDLIMETYTLCKEMSTQASAYIVLAGALGHPLCTVDILQAQAGDRVGVEILVPGTPAADAWVRDRKLRFRS